MRIIRSTPIQVTPDVDKLSPGVMLRVLYCIALYCILMYLYIHAPSVLQRLQHRQYILRE